jgi:glutaredoxin 3
MIDIYTIRYCPYCHDAKELLAAKGVEFHEIDASGNREIRQEMMARANGRSTFPQIFIGATHIGGCDDLYALEEAGKLDKLLAQDTLDQTKATARPTSKEQPA